MLQENERRGLVATLRYPEEAAHLVCTQALDIEHVTAQRCLVRDLLGRLGKIGGIDLIPRTIAQVAGPIHGLREDLTALHPVFHGALRGAPTCHKVQFAQIVFVLVCRSRLILLQRIQPSQRAFCERLPNLAWFHITGGGQQRHRADA
jgi:hypothetical protein